MVDACLQRNGRKRNNSDLLMIQEKLEKCIYDVMLRKIRKKSSEWGQHFKSIGITISERGVLPCPATGRRRAQIASLFRYIVISASEWRVEHLCSGLNTQQDRVP